MLVLMVASLCLTNYGCDEALKAYYPSRPAIKQTVKQLKREAADLIGETTMVALLPVASLAAGSKVSFRLCRYVAASYKDGNYMVNLSYSF